MQKTGSSLVVYGLIALFLLGGGAFFTSKLCQHRAVSKAEKQLSRGFGALAAETIQPYRGRLAKNADGCKVLAQIYSVARRADQLELVGEDCLDHGIETPPVILGLANSQVLEGHDDQALRILNSSLQKFDKIPDIYYQMAQIFRRTKRDNEAVIAYQRAVDRAKGDHQLELEALQYFSSLNQWADAKQMADRLKSAQTENPEVRLVIARAFLKSGDRDDAKSEVTLAEAIVAKDAAKSPGLKAALQKKYPDVYKPL